MSQITSRPTAQAGCRDEPGTPQEVQAFVQRNLRWNMAVGIVDAVFVALAQQVISNETVIPLLVTRLGGSAVILGLVGALYNLGHFMPQLLMAGPTEERRYKKPMTFAWGGGGRLPYFAIGLAILLWGESAPGLALAVFVALRTLAAICMGMIIPAWLTLVGKVIPTTRRGVFLGIGRGLGALLGVGGALLAGHLLETQPYPLNFALCFFIAATAMVISWAGMAAHREPPDLVVKPRTPLPQSLARLPRLMRGDANYRHFLAARSVGMLGTMAMSFVIVYGARRFGLTGQQVGMLTATISVSQGVLYVAWGGLADRIGHKAVLCAGTLALAGASLVALVTPVVGGLYVAFALVGAALSSDAISGGSIVLEFAPESERPTYVGLTNTLLAPFRTLAPIIGGALATGLGYPGLFVIAAALSAAGALLLMVCVREPRTLRPRLM